MPDGMQLTTVWKKEAGATDGLQEKSGFLHKKSPSLLGGWQERFIKLKDRKMRYFKGQNATFPAGVLNFDHFEISICMSKSNNCCFNMTISGIDNRTFEFKAASASAAQEWHDEILKHI